MSELEMRYVEIVPISPANVTLQSSSLRAEWNQELDNGQMPSQEETMPPCRFARPLATLLASASTLLFVASPTLAQDKTIELKLSHWVPPTHPLQKAMEEWGASVEKASNGTIKSKIFPSQQLGKAFDHYDMARDGIADFTYVNPGYQPGRFPIISAGELPFLVGESKGGIRAIDSWYRKYAANEMKDVKYCFSFILDPLTWHSSKKKIQVPGDIKGISVRPSQATVAAWVTLLGGTNVQASATEVRDVIEKGVAEAVTFPWGSVPLLGVDKVTKYHMDAPLHTVTFQWLMSPRTYAAMSSAQKKVIDDHCTTEWAGKFADPWADFEHAGLAKVKAMPGHEVFTITDAQLNEWKKSAEPLEKQWTDNVRKTGGDPDAIMKELKGSLAQYKAAY
jgi:TRAP-type C4-dicarboxylate transport system substrate-binding protein